MRTRAFTAAAEARKLEKVLNAQSSKLPEANVHLQIEKNAYDEMIVNENTTEFQNIGTALSLLESAVKTVSIV